MDKVFKKNKLAVLLSGLLITIIALGAILANRLTFSTSSSTTSNLNNPNNLPLSKQVDYLLDEIRSLKALMASTELKHNLETDLSNNNVDIKSITQEMKLDLLVSIRKTIQDELRNISLLDTSSNNSVQNSMTTTSTLDQAATTSQNEYDEQTSFVAEEKIDVVIEDAINNGTWSEDSNLLVMEAASLLTPEARQRLKMKLMTAVNNQQLSLSENILPHF